MPEITLLNKYNHINIIKYYDYFGTNQFLYIATEYCQVFCTNFFSKVNCKYNIF